MKIKKSVKVRVKENVTKKVDNVKKLYKRYDDWRTMKYFEKVNRHPFVCDENLNPM